jgi:hypothetical protein
MAFTPSTPHLLIAISACLRAFQATGFTGPGEYLEFGVFRGFSLWYAQALARDLGITNLRFFGFDSFLGLPPVNGIDQGGGFSDGGYYCSKPDVESFLTRYGVDWKSTRLVEGWYEDTLVPPTRQELGLQRCAICVVDCDLYSSATLVLRFVEPLLRDRSIIVFDDWGNYDGQNDRGEQRAFAEFLSENPKIRAEPFKQFGGHGCAFVLNIEN